MRTSYFDKLSINSETRPSKVPTSTLSYQAILDDEIPPIIETDVLRHFRQAQVPPSVPEALEGQEPLPERHCYLYSWCLMGNHVHLLIKESDEPNAISELAQGLLRRGGRRR